MVLPIARVGTTVRVGTVEQLAAAAGWPTMMTGTDHAVAATRWRRETAVGI